MKREPTETMPTPFEKFRKSARGIVNIPRKAIEDEMKSRDQKKTKKAKNSVK